MLPSRLTICHRTVQSSRIQAAPVERVERILTSEVLLSTRSLSLFPPCRTTINLRCWPMLYTPSEKLPQHARTRGEDWVLESCCHDRERYRGRCSGRFSAGVGSTTGAQRMGRGEPCVWLLYASLTGLFSSSSVPLPSPVPASSRMTTMTRT